MKKSLLIVAALLLVGCKGLKTTMEVPVYIHDTSYIAKEVHDSTFIDRWHTICQKGDTIFITNEVTKIMTKIKTDTAYKYIENPVAISKTETVEVKKPLTWWQKTLLYSGAAVWILTIGWVVFKYLLPIVLPTKNSN